jgi:CRP-like cAMP-binding protein
MAPLDMPSLGDAIGLKRKILELEKEVKRLKTLQMRKDSLIEKLRRKCGVKQRTSKTQVMEMVMGGASAAEIMAKIGCSRSSVVRARSELRAAGYALQNKR